MGNSLRIDPGPGVAGLGGAGRRLRRPLEVGAGRRQEGEGAVGDQHLPPAEAQPPKHRSVPWRLYPIARLLYRHGILSLWASLQLAAGGEGGSPKEVGGVDETDRHGDELPAPA